MSADHVENPQQRWLPCLPAPGPAVRQSSWSGVWQQIEKIPNVGSKPSWLADVIYVLLPGTCYASDGSATTQDGPSYPRWLLIMPQPALMSSSTKHSSREYLHQSPICYGIFFTHIFHMIFYRASLNFVQSTSIRRAVLGSHPVFKSLPHCRQLEEVGARCWQLSAQEVRPVSKERGVRAVCKKRCPLPCQSAPSSGRR